MQLPLDVVQTKVLHIFDQGHLTGQQGPDGFRQFPRAAAGQQKAIQVPFPSQHAVDAAGQLFRQTAKSFFTDPFEVVGLPPPIRMDPIRTA